MGQNKKSKTARDITRMLISRQTISIPPHAVFPDALEAGIRACRDLMYRLPMNWRIHSGSAMPYWMDIRLHPHLLTVAGAAQALLGISEKNPNIQSIT